MKTSLAIALAAVALMFSATVVLKSGAATAGYDHAYKSPGRCGIVACAYPDQAPNPSRPYRGR